MRSPLVRSSAACSLAVLGLEILGGGIGAAVNLDHGDAQIGFSLAHDLNLAAKMLELGSPFVEQPRLHDQAFFQFLGATAEDFVFATLRH